MTKGEEKLRLILLEVDGLYGPSLEDFLNEQTHSSGDSDIEAVRYGLRVPRERVHEVAGVLATAQFRLAEINNQTGTLGYEKLPAGATQRPVLVDPETPEITA